MGSPPLVILAVITRLSRGANGLISPREARRVWPVPLERAPSRGLPFSPSLNVELVVHPSTRHGEHFIEFV